MIKIIMIGWRGGARREQINDLFEIEELPHYNDWYNYMHLTEIEYPELHICKIIMGWKPLFEATKFYRNVK